MKRTWYADREAIKYETKDHVIISVRTHFGQGPGVYKCLAIPRQDCSVLEFADIIRVTVDFDQKYGVRCRDCAKDETGLIHKITGEVVFSLLDQQSMCNCFGKCKCYFMSNHYASEEEYNKMADFEEKTLIFEDALNHCNGFEQEVIRFLNPVVDISSTAKKTKKRK